MARKRIPLKAASVFMAAAVTLSSVTPAVPYVYAAETETELATESTETSTVSELSAGTSETQPESPAGDQTETQTEQPTEAPTETATEATEAPTETQTEQQTETETATEAVTETETEGQTEPSTPAATQPESADNAPADAQTGMPAANSLPAPQSEIALDGTEQELSDTDELAAPGDEENTAIYVEFENLSSGELSNFDSVESDTLRTMLDHILTSSSISVDGYTDEMESRWSAGGSESACDVSMTLAEVHEMLTSGTANTLNIYAPDAMSTSGTSLLVSFSMEASVDDDGMREITLSAEVDVDENAVLNIHTAVSGGATPDVSFLTQSYDMNEVIFGILAAAKAPGITYDPNSSTYDIAQADGVEMDVIENGSGLRKTLTDENWFNGASLLSLTSNANASDNIYVLYKNGSELARVRLSGSSVTSDSGTGRFISVTSLSLPGDCTVTYNLNGGTLTTSGLSTSTLRGRGDTIGSFEITGSDISSSSTFIGWYTAANGGEEVFTTDIVTGNMTLYAHYADLSSYEVQFNWGFAPNFEAGSAYSETYTFEVGSRGTYWLGDVPEPTRDGYYFAGWFDASGNPLKAVDDANRSDKVFTARWSSSPSSYVTYHMNDGSGRSFKVYYNEAGYYPNSSGGRGDLIDISSYTSNMFRGWSRSENGDVISNGTSVSSGADLYAIWSSTVTITFDSGLAQFQYDPINVLRGQAISASVGDTLPDDYELPVPVWEGHTFAGWYTNETGGSRVTMDTIASQSMDLVARWDVDTYEVTYDANGGTVNGDSTDSVDIEQNARIGALPTPTRQDYSFLGWFTARTGGTQITTSTRVTGDITYYAHWSRNAYTVTFDATDGFVNGNSVITVEPQSTVTNIPTASADGKVFVGWFLDREGNTPFTSDTVITESIIVYAVWEDIDENTSATVTFDAQGGVSSELNRVVVKNEAVGALPTATYEGYTFLGWYTRPTSGSRVTASTLIENDITFYAHWVEGDTPVTSLALNHSSLEVMFGDDLDLEYSYSPADADNAEFYWTSSDETVIRVAGDNSFVYVGAGTTTLTVHTIDNSMEASCEVTVTREPVLVESIAFDEPTQVVTIGDGLDLSVTYSPKGAENAQFVWSSSDPEIIRVSEDGTIWNYGGQTGTVTITIATTDGKSSASCTITVNPKESVPTDPEEFPYTITFDSNGGSDVEPIILMDGETISNLPVPIREGFSFDGWFTAGGVQMTEITGSQDLTLYARWTNIQEPVITFKVTFDAQNGSATTSKDYAEGEALGALPEVSRDGFTLIGWFTSARGGEQVTAETTVSKTMTIYAQWEAAPEEFVLKLNPTGGQINGVSGIMTHEAKLQVGSESGNSLGDLEVTRQGFTFLGWYNLRSEGELVYDTEGNAVDGNYFQDGKFIGEEDLTVYAQWAENGTEYTLNLNSRGGSAVESKDYAAGTTVTEFETPTRDGYTFLGWFTDPTTGEKVESIYMDSDKVIYAHWQLNETEDDTKDTYTIRFDAQGGSAVEDIVADEGESVALPETTREGFIFEGWYTEAEGGIRLTSITANRDMTVYAHWSEEPDPVYWTLTLNYMDGRISTRDVLEGDVVENFPSASRNGYTFLGWYDAMEGGNEVTSVTMDANKTVYARWEAIQPETPEEETYTITFDAQGGSAVEAITDDAGTTISEFPEPTREGYTFKGWFLTKEGGNRVISINLSSNITLYAQWEEIVVGEYTVTFDYQDGIQEKVTVKEGGTVTFPEASRDGYTFLGWFTAAEGGEAASESTAITGDVTYFAHWEEIPAKVYTITLDPQGGVNNAAVTDGGIKAEEGTKVTEFPAPTRDGYTFLGWYTRPTGGFKVASVTVRSDVTLYAHWSDNTQAPEQVSTLLLNKSSLTIQYGTSPLGLTYKYGPAGAENAEFVWTSSNPNVIAVVENTAADGTVTQGFRYTGIGETTMTIATRDGSISDSCVVTVVPASTASTGTGTGTGVTTGPTGSYNPGTGTGTGTGSGTGTGTPAGSETETGNDTENGTDQPVTRISLRVTTETGSVKNVTVNSDVLLSALAEKLGYTVASYTAATGDGQAEDIPGSTTIGELVALADDDTLVIGGYDTNGNELGYATVTAAEDGYEVAIEAAEADGSTDGSDDGASGAAAGSSSNGGSAGGSSSGTSESGAKGDAVTDSVATGDIPVWGYAAGAGILALLIVLLGILRRKKGQEAKAESDEATDEQPEDKAEAKAESEMKAEAEAEPETKDEPEAEPDTKDGQE